jgi:chromosome segregation ATPase
MSTVETTPGLDELRAAHERALSERDLAAADVEEAKNRGEGETAELASKLGMGKITAGEYDAAKQDASDRIAVAEAVLDRVELVVGTIAEQAADEAEREAEQALQPLRARVDALKEEIDGLTRRLAEARSELDTAIDEHSIAAADVFDARSEFVVDEAARERRRYDLKLIHWHTLNPAGPAPPARLRAAVEEHRRDMLEEHERARAGLRRQSEASLRAAGLTPA